MNHVRARLVIAVVVSWPGAVRAEAIEIQHEPLACAAADRFARVAAKGSPAEAVRAAELQFRTEPEGPWYSTAMKAEGGVWSAVLPRPTVALAGFEYRISMTAASTETAETPAFAVAVRDDSAACGAAAQSSVTSSIVVRVPGGAPVVPPVPRGFSPTGVVAAQEREPAKSRKGLVILGTAGAAGAMAVLGLTGPPDPTPQRAPLAHDVPDFLLEGTVPPTESTISISRGTLQLVVRMSREPREPLTLDWTAFWQESAFQPACVRMAGTLNDAQRPTELVLTAPLVATGVCGSAFDASLAQVTIRVGGQLYLSRTFDLPFRFEP